MRVEQRTICLFVSLCVMAGSAAVTADPQQKAAPAQSAPPPEVQPPRPEGDPPPVHGLDRELPTITPGEPMNLAQALGAAEKRNLTLAATRLELEKSQAQLASAWGLVLPGAQGKVQFMRRDHEDSVNFSEGLPESMQPPGGSSEMVVMPQHDLKGTLEVGLTLINVESWYKISVAKSGVELARMTIRQVRQQVLLGVAQAYYVALMAQSLIQMSESQVHSTSHHLKVAQARFDAGTGLRIDVIRAQTDLEQAHQELLTAHLAFDNARDALAILTGRKGLPMPQDAPPIEIPQESDEVLARQAVRDRPDVKSKRMMEKLFAKQLDQSWMQFLPTLDAAWQLQYQFTKPGDIGSADRSRWTALVTLSVPIYNQFRYGDLDLKRASLRQAAIQRQDAEQNVSLEVRKARRDCLTAFLSVDSAAKQEQLAKEALVLVEAAYNAGTGSSLDVTDARRTAAAAEINLATKRLESQIALLSLLNSVGQDLLDLSKK